MAPQGLILGPQLLVGFAVALAAFYRSWLQFGCCGGWRAAYFFVVLEVVDQRWLRWWPGRFAAAVGGGVPLVAVAGGAIMACEGLRANLSLINSCSTRIFFIAVSCINLTS